MDDCLASSNDKYKLYETCIGKFTKACVVDSSAYAHVMKDISVGSTSRNCMEREAMWWDELFKEYSQELTQRTDDQRIQDALKTTLASMGQRAVQECDYVTTRWGYREAERVQLQGLEDQFRCMRDISAENAITVYLWDEKHP
ncbi:MAG: hypothetical protein DI582_10040 [Azospirillum brasilense]|nr:MAG: hypothetical protein DI582_10040 [Azospirillum brasilense]